MVFGVKVLLLYLSKVLSEYIYPEWISSSSSYTVFKNTRVSDNNYISSTTLHSFEDCIQSCPTTDSSCKSVGLQIIDNKTIYCKTYSEDSPTTKKQSGYFFVTKKAARCSQSCNLKKNACGKCKCQPSCSGRNRRQHICNCTKAAGEKKSCQSHYQSGFNQTGIYQINPTGNASITTLCEMNKNQSQIAVSACPFVNYQVVYGYDYYRFYPRDYLTMDDCTTFCRNEIYSGKSEISIAKLTGDGCECIEGSISNMDSWFYTTFCKLGSDSQQDECHYGTNDFSITGNTVSAQLYSKELCVEKCISRYTNNPDYRYNNYYLRGVNTQPFYSWCECVFLNSNYQYYIGEYSTYISCIFQPSSPSPTISSSLVWIPMMTRYSSWENDFWDKNYEAYTSGFGLVNQQWIGLENLYKITSVLKTNMRVDYSFIDGVTVSTIYNDVKVDTKENLYQFSYASYDARGSYEFDRFYARGAKFLSCNNWWSYKCNDKWYPTSVQGARYSSEVNLRWIQFLLQTN